MEVPNERLDNRLAGKDIVEKLFYLNGRLAYYKSRLYNKNFKISYLDEKEISEKQFMVLMLISVYHVNTVTRMARLLCQTTGSMSTLLTKMVKEDYISKAYPQTGDDRRKVYYSVTEKGRVIFDKYARISVEQIKDFMLSFKAESRMVFYEGCKALTDVFEKQNDDELLSLIIGYDVYSPEQDHRLLEMIKKLSAVVIWFSRRYTEQFDLNKDNDSMTPARFFMLTYMCTTDYESISSIAKHLYISESAVSITMSKLVDEGLIKREYPTNTEDGRKIYFYPTDEGMNQFNHIKQNIEKMFESFFFSLSDSDKKQFITGIDNIIKAFD